MSMDTAAADLASTCGTGEIRPGARADAVNGLTPAYVVTPASYSELSAAVRTAARHGLAIVPRGAGTKLSWANRPRRLDLLLDVSGLSGVVEHTPGDLVATVQAGTPVQELQDRLGAAGQCLAADEPAPGSTVGGLIATALSGPRRMSYGAVRDLLIGLTIVRPDGVVARSGGKVVKNVAGYDLGKLYAGSFGTLGVIAEATFRLHPVPAARLYVRITYPDRVGATAGLAAARSSALAPAALEIECGQADGDITMSALMEGSPAGAASRAERMAALLGPGAEITSAIPPGWGEIPGPATIRLTMELSAIPSTIAAAGAAASAAGVVATIRGSAGTGILYLGFTAGEDPHPTTALLTALRQASAAAGGYATLVRAPDAVRDGVDAWGPVPGLELMRAVKKAFDRDDLFSPGRFVGGI